VDAYQLVALSELKVHTSKLQSLRIDDTSDYDNQQYIELLARIWEKLMHIMHGNGVVPPPSLELAATRSHRNTLRRRTLRQAQNDKLSSAMFIIDLQLRSLRNAVNDIQVKLPAVCGPVLATTSTFSREVLLQVRTGLPISAKTVGLLPVTMQHVVPRGPCAAPPPAPPPPPPPPICSYCPKPATCQCNAADCRAYVCESCIFGSNPVMCIACADSDAVSRGNEAEFFDMFSDSDSDQEGYGEEDDDFEDSFVPFLKAAVKAVDARPLAEAFCFRKTISVVPESDEDEDDFMCPEHELELFDVDYDQNEDEGFLCTSGCGGHIGQDGYDKFYACLVCATMFCYRCGMCESNGNKMKGGENGTPLVQLM